jgi:TetR/AcrR family transcriptional regulator, lmrAB and yxaGH operons repressor
MTPDIFDGQELPYQGMFCGCAGFIKELAHRKLVPIVCRTTYMSSERRECGPMSQRSDAKLKMIDAARRLIRERGYHATALSDVLELSGAPRGSVYFHFPGGKTQLAAEVAKAYARDQADMIGRAAEASDSAADLVTAYVTRARENLIKSNYTQGCTIAPLALEGGGTGSDPLAGAVSAAFSLMQESLAFQFAFFGMSRANARELAEVVVAGVEGALVTARAFQSPAPFDSMRAVLVNHAERLSASGPATTPEPVTTPPTTSEPLPADGHADADGHTDSGGN